MNIPIYQTEEEIAQEKREIFLKGITLGCGVLTILFLVLRGFDIIPSGPRQDKALILNVQIEGVGVLDFYPSPESSSVLKKIGTNGFVISGLQIKKK